MKNGIKIKITSVVNIGLFILIYALLLKYNDNNIRSFELAIGILGSLSVLCSIWYAILCIKEKVKIYDFRLWYIILNTMFVMGQVILCFIGKGEEFIFWKIIYKADVRYILSGGLLALAIQHAIVTALFMRSNIALSNKSIKEYSPKMLWNTGLIVFLTFLPFKVYYDVKYILLTHASNNYISSASAELATNGMIITLGLISVVGLFYMIESKYLSRKSMIKLIIPIILYYILVMTLTGDRRYSVCALICIVLCLIHSYKIKIKLKTLIGISALGLFSLALLSVIRNTRNIGGVGGIVNFLSMLFNKMLNGEIIWDTFAEFGLTLMCYVYTRQYFPSVFSFTKGSQMLMNAVAILPVGPLLNNWKNRVDIQGLVYTMTNNHVGASLGSDLYGNFGLLAVIAAFIFGIFLAKVLNIENIEKSNYSAAKYFSLMYIFIDMVRAGFSELFRIGFYSYIIPIIIITLLSRKSRKA